MRTIGHPPQTSPPPSSGPAFRAICPKCGARLELVARMVDVVVVLAEHVELAHGRYLVALVSGEQLLAGDGRVGGARAYQDPEPSPSWRSWSASHDVPEVSERARG